MDRAKRGLLVGIVLGDGYLNVRTRYRASGKSYISSALRVLHGAQQRAYCEWKAQRVCWALGGRHINVTKVKNGPEGKYEAFQFTVDHAYFQTMKPWVYPEGKKRFTSRVLDMLTPEGLAIWYMDDGHARRNVSSAGYVTSVGSDIATCCSEAEIEAIADWFAREYGIVINPRFDKKRGYWSISMNTRATRELAGIIQSYVPECMLYKLSHVADLKTQERRTPVGYCQECGDVLYRNTRKGCCTACYSRQYRAMI